MTTRTDTRTKIQEVALELFGEQGYDKTSLREIAERLGVTKAALYYHFKTKEEIVTSLFEAASEGINTLVEWTKNHEPTLENRRELVRRYAQGLAGGQGFKLMRLVHENQHTLKELAAGLRDQDRMKTLLEFMVDQDAPLATQLKAKLSLFVQHFGVFALEDSGTTPAERHAAAIEVAMEMVDSVERDLSLSRPRRQRD